MLFFLLLFAGGGTLLIHIRVIAMRKPLTQVVATNWTALIETSNLFPAFGASPMSAPRWNTAVHGAVPFIWDLMTDRTLVWYVAPEALPFLFILPSKL